MSILISAGLTASTAVVVSLLISSAAIAVEDKNAVMMIARKGFAINLEKVIGISGSYLRNRR